METLIAPSSYLKVPEVAARLRMSEETVRRWLRRGRIRGIVWSDRLGWRVAIQEVERFEREGPLREDEDEVAA